MGVGRKAGGYERVRPPCRAGGRGGASVFQGLKPLAIARAPSGRGQSRRRQKDSRTSGRGAVSYQLSALSFQHELHRPTDVDLHGLSSLFFAARKSPPLPLPPSFAILALLASWRLACEASWRLSWPSGGGGASAASQAGQAPARPARVSRCPTPGRRSPSRSSAYSACRAPSRYRSTPA